MKNINILVAGVGGQGTLLTSRILGRLAQQLGLDVKLSEVHGMAQRGGSVMTYVRMGENIHSPLIEEGGADLLLAFEKMEALRYAHYVKEGGEIVVNLQQIDPMPVIMGAEKYPDDVYEKLQNCGAAVHGINAAEMAMALGDVRVGNVILLGVMAKLMDVEKQTWLDVVAACVPPKTVEMNLAAFEKGYAAV